MHPTTPPHPIYNLRSTFLLLLIGSYRSSFGAIFNFKNEIWRGVMDFSIRRWVLSIPSLRRIQIFLVRHLTSLPAKIIWFELYRYEFRIDSIGFGSILLSISLGFRI